MSTDEVTLHRVDAGNAALLDRVDDDVFDHAVRPELLAAFLANPANVLMVAVAQGTVIGMATGIAYVHPDKPLQMFVNELGVSARWAGRGIGKRLMSALLARARALGCTEAWVATEEGNAAARAVYAGLGGRLDEQLAAVYVYPLGEGAASG